MPHVPALGSRPTVVAALAVVAVAIIVGVVTWVNADEPPRFDIVQTSDLDIPNRELNPILHSVTLELRDPGSAIFYELQAERDLEGYLSVCGEVAAKNGFGGYSHRQPFFAAERPPHKAPHGEGTVLGVLSQLGAESDANPDYDIADEGPKLSVTVGLGC